MRALIVILYLIIHPTKAETIRDLGEVFDLSFKASYKQFEHPHFLPQAMLSYPVLGVSFQQDQRITSHYGKNSKSTWLESLDALAIASNFNILPIAFYYYGRSLEDQKMVKFSQDVLASWILASIETVGLSLIDVHSRPSTEKESFWETAFRGNSSFPSGHVIPMLVLAHQTAFNYGAGWASIPYTLSALMAWQRIESKKHYTSDIVGAFFITLWASQGVRQARKEESKTSSLQLTPIWRDGHYGMGASYSF